MLRRRTPARGGAALSFSTFFLFYFFTFGKMCIFEASFKRLYTMKISQQTVSQINEVLNGIIEKFPAGSDNKIMTDLSFQARSDSGELTVFDDNDETVASGTIDDWIDYQDDDFEEVVRDALRQCFQSRKEELENLSLLKPYTFDLVDENKETICELFLVDDNTILIDHEELMKGLGDDLDAFLDKLLKE
jgi:hypothetical protein